MQGVRQREAWIAIAGLEMKVLMRVRATLGGDAFGLFPVDIDGVSEGEEFSVGI